MCVAPAEAPLLVVEVELALRMKVAVLGSVAAAGMQVDLVAAVDMKVAVVAAAEEMGVGAVGVLAVVVVVDDAGCWRLTVLFVLHKIFLRTSRILQLIGWLSFLGFLVYTLMLGFPPLSCIACTAWTRQYGHLCCSLGSVPYRNGHPY